MDFPNFSPPVYKYSAKHVINQLKDNSATFLQMKSAFENNNSKIHSLHHHCNVQDTEIEYLKTSLHEKMDRKSGGKSDSFNRELSRYQEGLLTFKTKLVITDTKLINCETRLKHWEKWLSHCEQRLEGYEETLDAFEEKLDTYEERLKHCEDTASKTSAAMTMVLERLAALEQQKVYSGFGIGRAVQ